MRKFFACISVALVALSALAPPAFAATSPTTIRHFATKLPKVSIEVREVAPSGANTSAFEPVTFQASEPTNEAGYVIHFELGTEKVRRAIIDPVHTVSDVWMIRNLDISLLYELRTNIGLGVGFGTSGNLDKAGRLRWQAGLSFLDDFTEQWKPKLGIYAGGSLRFT
jgi:hypothetical protein